MIRLDKFLSLAGFGSRREVSQLIRSYRVKVNDKIIISPSFKFDPQKETIFVDGHLIPYCQFYYYKFYKPLGVLTSTKDKEKTIMDLLPSKLPGRRKIFPVGRLDKDAEGLILLTNDGKLAHFLLHPKWKVSKVYEVEIDAPLREEDKLSLEEGIELKDGPTLPSQIEFLDPKKSLIKITVLEGRYHLLKRIFKKLGYSVLKIKRIAFGPLFLGDLKPVEVRALTWEEIKALKEAIKK